MKFNLYGDVKIFYRDTFNVLMRHEAQNLIPLGNIIIGNAGEDKTGWRDPAAWFMATVTDGADILLTAVMTPPFNLTLYAADNKINDSAIDCLVKGMIAENTAVPGIMSDNVLAERFAKAWAEKKNTAYSIAEKLRIHELREVNPEIPETGKIRPLEEKDLSFFPYWVEGFNHDCFGNEAVPEADIDKYRYSIGRKKVYILEHEGRAVSMASKNREMQSVCGVGMVYTPPYFRGKGCASSCVASLSRLILDKGFSSCVLYTDLANPVSNSIYRKIGYMPVCDSLQIKFEGMQIYNRV